jgi:hypothetical protein
VSDNDRTNLALVLHGWGARSDHLLGVIGDGSEGSIREVGAPT